MANVYRADQTGSLIAPPAAGAAGADGAQAVKAVLALQKQCGVDIYSDGQLLRASTCSIFADSVAGVATDEEPKEARLPYVAGPLQRKWRLTAVEAGLLKRAAPGAFKIALPAPTVAATQMFREGITDAHYPTRRDLAVALAAILREEVADLIADGVPYIQLNGPAYEIAAEGGGAARLGNAEEMLRLDAEALKDLRRPDNIALALRLPRPRDVHGALCQAPGASEKRAVMLEMAFARMPVDRFLIELPAEAAEADLTPLRAVPAGRMAVLGLVDPLAPRADDVDPLLDKLDLAVTFVGAERLALSPRYGLADPGVAHDPQAFEAQRRSLTLTVETALRFWGFEI